MFPRACLDCITPPKSPDKQLTEIDDRTADLALGVLNVACGVETKMHLTCTHAHARDDVDVARSA